MNRYFLTALTLCTTLALHAQADKNARRSSITTRFMPGTAIIKGSSSQAVATMPAGSLLGMKPVIDYSYPGKTTPMPSGRNSVYGTEAHPQGNYSTNNTPTTNDDLTATDDDYAYGDLHRGLNASVDLSVMAAFGRHAPRGAGFAQRVNATYLSPLGKHGWLATGGYLQHLNWDGVNATSGGLYAELGYRFNDHWAVYVYGQKNLVNSGLPGYPAYYANGMGYYGMGPAFYGTPYYNNMGDKIGAAVRWTPNPTFSVQLSVEKNWYPNNNYYGKQYDYPVPIR